MTTASHWPAAGIHHEADQEPVRRWETKLEQEQTEQGRTTEAIPRTQVRRTIPMLWSLYTQTKKNREIYRKKERAGDRTTERKICFESWKLALLTFTCLNLEHQTLTGTKQGADEGAGSLVSNSEAEGGTVAKVSAPLKLYSVIK